jgi:hypothetical protein
MYCICISTCEAILAGMATKYLTQCLPLRSITMLNCHIYVEVSLHPLFQCIWCPRRIIFEVLLVRTYKILYITSCIFELITTLMSRVVGFNLNTSPSSICRSMNPLAAIFLFTDCTNLTPIIVYVLVIVPLLDSLNLQCSLEDIRIHKLLPKCKRYGNFQAKLLIELLIPFLPPNIV